MKHFALALLFVAVGCKKANDAGGVGAAGSGSAAATASGPGSAAGSAPGSATGSAPGSAAGSAPGSAAPSAAFDDKLAMPSQPARGKDEQARVDGAADALRTALTQARTAATSAELCKAFEPLNKAMTKLQQISAPKGIDQQAFSSERSSLLQLFDGASNWCDSPANVGLDTLQEVMSDIRTRFVALVGRGAS